MSTGAPKRQDLILYDGVCGLCNRFVQFILARDHADRFRFATLQSDLGREIVLRHGGDPSAISTVYLIENWGDEEAEHARIRGKAALYAIHRLGGIWRILGAARILPAFFLDAGYRLVARFRYRLFGRLETCPVPTPETRRKFLDAEAKSTTI